MVDLKLGQNEGIILQSAYCGRYGTSELEMEEIYLTNENIICVYDKNTGLFSKTEMVTEKIPLSSIKIVDGNVQIREVDDEEYGLGLQILYKDSNRELFVFEHPKKELKKWYSAIIDAVNKIAAIESQKSTVKEIAAAQKDNETTVKHIYCVNCGEKLAPTMKFCSNCGAKVVSPGTEAVVPPPIPPQEKPPVHIPVDNPAAAKSQETYVERKTVYKGEVHKCPACGEVLQSMTAICPACGHEISNAKVASSLTDFINEINAIDKVIANTSKLDKPQKGWKTWKKTTRILWVLLNIVTSFIPLVIYLVLPLFRPLFKKDSTPELTTAEQQKVSLIENFTFPNDRESMLEALLFTKSKMAFIASAKATEKNVFWLRLWNTKATQLHQKANILLKNDAIAETALKEMAVNRNTVKRKVQVRAGIGAIIIGAFLIFVGLNGSLYSGIWNLLPSGSLSTGSPSSDEKFEWLKTGLSTELPELQGTGGHIWKNSEEELDIYIEGISYSQFDAYIVSCKEKGFTVDAIKDTDKYTAYNSIGYKLELQHWSSERLDINLKAPLVGDENFEWPSHAFADLVPRQDGKTGTVETANDDTLKIILYDVLSSEVKFYISECESAGFTIDAEKKDTSFNGFNADGYELSVSYNEMKAMSITINAPIQMTEISWPSSGPAKLIPKPSFSVGKISSDYDWAFSVYLGDMTIDDFNAYVDKCIDKGFEKDYRSEHYFSADKGDDISLTVEYVGFNTIVIRIYDYNQF